MPNKKQAAKKSTESVSQSLHNVCSILLDLLICVYVLLLLAVLPFYSTQGFGRIGTDKATFFLQSSMRMWCVILPVGVCSLVLGVIAQRIAQKNWKATLGYYVQKMKSLSSTDYFALLYGVAVVLSYYFTDYRDVALWGAGGWYMGLGTQLTLVGLYFFISKVWKHHKWIFHLIFPVSTVVFLLGILNRFGYYPIDMQLEDPSFISTIGNINWYCGYLVIPFFLGVGLYWLGDFKHLWQKILWWLYLLIGFIALVSQGSASGIFALAIVTIVMFALSARDGERMMRFWQIMLLLSTACLTLTMLQLLLPGRMSYIDGFVRLLTMSPLPIVMTIVSFIMVVGVYNVSKKGKYPQKLFQTLSKVAIIACVVLLGLYILIGLVNTLRPEALTVLSGNAAFTFNTNWASNRGATWLAGWLCSWEQEGIHKLVGVGPDCMSSYIYLDGSAELSELVVNSFGPSTRLTNAHNEWLTILADIGILGIVGFAGMVVTAIYRFLRGRQTKVIAAAVGLALLAYTCNNLFSFQQAMNVSTMFVVFGMGAAFEKK